MTASTIQIVLLVLVVAAGAVFLVVAGKRAERQRENRFSERRELTFDEFYRQYYEHSGLDAERVRAALQEVAAAIHVPATRLRPTDRFSVELAPAKGWEVDDGAALLARAIRADSRKAGQAQIQTLDDYLRTVGSVS